MKHCVKSISKSSLDLYFESCKSEMVKLIDNNKYCGTGTIIEYLKSQKNYYRWDLFCWLIQNYSFSNEEQCRLFKFAWIFSAPDVKAVEILEQIDIPSLMKKSEQKELANLTDKVKVYKAVSWDCMETDDEEWELGVDWKWSTNIEKVAYIAHCMGTNYIVISTTIPKSQVLALFHGVYFSYELIAIASFGEFDDYTIEIEHVDSFLKDHPYYHEPVTEENIYKSTGF